MEILIKLIIWFNEIKFLSDVVEVILFVFIITIIIGIWDAWKTGNELKRDNESLKKRYAKKEKDKWRELS